MDDVTANVLAETWDSGAEPDGWVNVGTITAIPADGSFIATHGWPDDEDKARLRLAACAPGALRLLLEAEWGGSDMGSSAGFCPWCECSKHLPDCRWLALMKKAGLR